MSEVEKEDYKNEYLPLVGNSEEKGIVNRSISSDQKLNSKLKSGGATDVNLGGEQTFYQKNKKTLKYVGIGVLIIGVILAIVLPLTLGKGGDNPPGPQPPNPPVPPVPPVPPQPDPVQPDPFHYQEYNPYLLDTNTPPVVDTFQANFMLKFNTSSAAQMQNSDVRVHRPRKVKEVPKVIRNFMGFEDIQEKKVAQDQLNGTNYRPVNPTYISNNLNNEWSARINVSVTMNKGQQARVLLTNPDLDPQDAARRLVNNDFLPRPDLEIESRLQQVGFQYNTTGSFSFNFTDIYAQETLVSTMYRKMLITDLYSEVGLVLPTQRCFGLGQRNGKFQVNQGTYTFNARARDDSLPQDDGLGGKSGNHIHPFLMCQTNITKEFFGLFFVSTGPQVFEVIKFVNSTKMVVNYITVGGALEFYVIMLGNAQNIVSRYQSLVGMPMMPPYYALGVFHGSNSYDRWSQIKAVYDNYNGSATGEKQALEGVFVEKYNQKPHWTFTVDTDKYPNLGVEVDNIHNRNQKIIFGASLALNPDNDYPWYVQAKNSQCLVKSIGTIAIGPLTGILDQTNVTYLDSFSGCYDSFMSSILPDFDNSTSRGLDGLLLQDAHAPNHINGQVLIPTATGVSANGRKLQAKNGDPVQAPLNEEMVGNFMPYQINNDTQQQGDLSTYNLPFIPAFKYSGALDNMSISLNATLGSPNRYSTLLVRNGMSGWAIKRTYNVVQQSLLKNNSRPLLFSDASFAGSGAYATALLTDQYRSWNDMSNIINQVLGLSMYGFSATMVDTCGSLGPMDEDLCARWTQLATFMPMVRNYFNDTYRDPATGQRLKTDSSEPWNAQKDKLKLAYAALGERLKLTRYIYSQMYMTHTNGGALSHPLFFDFPTDDGSFNDAAISQTFMLGDAVKVSPVLANLNQGDQYQAYFPPGLWVSINDPSQIINATAGGVNAALTADSATVNIHQKSGTVLPYLYNNMNLRTTRDIETNLPTAIRIVRDPWNKQASGDIMIDDGISPNLFSPDYFNIYQWKVFDKNFAHYNVRVSSANTINFQLLNGDIDYKPAPGMMYQYLDKIEIHAAEDLQNVDFACGINRGFSFIPMTAFYNNGTKTLVIKPVQTNVTFDQLNIVKFGQTGKDPQYCNGFFYTSNLRDDNDTYARFDLIPNDDGILKDLVAEFWLLDDDGSINVEITTEEDYKSGNKILYRPPMPEFYTLDNFLKKPPTKNLFDFLQQANNTEFSYIIMNKNKEEVYRSDPLRLLIDTHFTINGGLFKTNPLNGYPLYGIGERAGRAHLKDQKDFVHTIWPQDQPNPIDDNKPPGKNMYGYQPVYYYQSNTTEWVAVFDIGTYASDYFINTNVDGQNTTRITKITTGGMIHKIFLQGATIEQTMVKYQMLTGFQTVPPMWAFGWNQCKFGYYDSQMWWNAYQGYKTFNLPLDTMWGDIDYMDDYKVFTYSEQSYYDLPDKVNQIHAEGRHFVPIIDDAIAVRPGQGYAPYEDGLAKQVFVMRKDKSGPTTGGVWPGHAYYPDFFQDATQKWWSDNLQAFNQKVQFDGIWLDMNEASSTCTGYCYDSERPRDAVKYELPYWPGARDLEVQALGLDSIYMGVAGPNNTYRTELDLRSLYAIKESQATFNYLKQNNKRPFILSRSNAPGLQKYAFHWLADNWSREEWLSSSVDSLFEYNLFGIPMMGSDICGFNLEPTAELCTRWHQLGSFYPFSRNHKNSVWKQTEPYQYNFTVPELNDGRTYTDLIRTSLLQRYSILRYIYSQFHEIGQFGGAFFKPLYYEYQADPMTFDDDANQVNIQLGHALKLSIQTRDLNQLSTQYLFPADRWCQVMPVIDKSKCWDTTTQGGDSTVQRLNSTIADYQVHIRGGHIMPFQDAFGLKVNMSKDLMSNPTEMIALVNKANSQMNLATGSYNASAVGYVYFDDGTSSVDIVRVDVYVVLEADGSSTIHFKTIQQPQNPATMGNATTFSAITFLWASSTGFDKYVGKVTTLNKVTGGSVNLEGPVYDAATDSLRLQVKSKDVPTDSWNYWDIVSITMGK